MTAVLEIAFWLLFIGVTFQVAREGLWGAALVFFDTLLAGLIAFGTFEAVGTLWERQMWLGGFPRFFSLATIFAATVSILRACTDMIAPRRVKFPGLLEAAGKYVFGAATGWILTGMVACMLQVAPISKAPFGYQFGRVLHFGADVQWLFVMRYTSVLSISVDDLDNAFPPPQVFVQEYENFRPFGKSRR